MLKQPASRIKKNVKYYLGYVIKNLLLLLLTLTINIIKLGTHNMPAAQCLRYIRREQEKKTLACSVHYLLRYFLTFSISSTAEAVLHYRRF